MKKLAKVIPVILLLLLVFSALDGASAATTPQSLRMPQYTHTDSEWDENGRLINETAYDVNNNPALNTRGFHKAVYTWDAFGNPLTESYTGLNGEPVVADGGYAKVIYTYENNSEGVPHLVTEDRFNAEGGRASIPGGYSYRRDIWDGDQIFSTTYYDAQGSVTQPTGGYARILYSREEDENAIVITKRYEGVDGISLLGAEGGSKVIYTYAKGMTAAVNARVDNMGLGMLLPSGARGEYLPAEAPTSLRGELHDDDEHGYGDERKPMLLSTEIYSTDGARSLGAERWHREIRSYDDHGNLIRTDYYSADGEPIISAIGAASIVNTYDNLDRLVQVDYLDCEEHLVKMLNGYARVTYEYYGNSKRIHYERFFGADGERTMITRGMSMIEYEYSGGDWDYRETYYDIMDEYTQCNAGFVRIECKFEGQGEFGDQYKDAWILYPDTLKWHRYFGTDLQLIKVKAGYAGIENFPE